MKNAFVISQLSLGLGYLATLLLVEVGVLTTHVVTLGVFLCSYVAVGVLGIAFHDYGRGRLVSAGRRALPRRAPEKRMMPIPGGHMATWAPRTISA